MNLNEEELKWYKMLRKYIEDTAKYQLFEKEFKTILDKLTNSLLSRIDKQDSYIKMLEDKIDNLETTYLRYKKALTIINKKDLNIHFVKRLNLEDFNYQCRYEQQLTKDEYDLLKEVLNV